jgi:hypothetical protein
LDESAVSRFEVRHVAFNDSVGALDIARFEQRFSFPQSVPSLDPFAE